MAQAWFIRSTYMAEWPLAAWNSRAPLVIGPAGSKLAQWYQIGRLRAFGLFSFLVPPKGPGCDGVDASPTALVCQSGGVCDH